MWVGRELGMGEDPAAKARVGGEMHKCGRNGTGLEGNGGWGVAGSQKDK